MERAQHDPGEYGRNFADVYDEWYPGGDEEAIVAFLSQLLPSRARILELGVGTGRVALPLAEAGFRVTGLDSSPEMLETLTRKDPSGSVEQIRADAAAPGTWPPHWTAGTFDCVLAACNLLLNLSAPGAQREALAAVARVLVPDGMLVVERSRISMPGERTTEETTSTAASGIAVVVSTDADPGTGIVRGEHRHAGVDGEVMRSWEIRTIEDADFRRWCSDAGLSEVSTHSGWHWEPGDQGARTDVTVHQRTA